MGLTNRCCMIWDKQILPDFAILMGMYIEMYAIHVIHTIRMWMFPVYTLCYIYISYVYIYIYIVCIYIYMCVCCLLFEYMLYKYIYVMFDNVLYYICIYQSLSLSLYIYIFSLICSIWTLPLFFGGKVGHKAMTPLFSGSCLLFSLKFPVGSRWPRLIFQGMFPKSWGVPQ